MTGRTTTCRLALAAASLAVLTACGATSTAPAQPDDRASDLPADVSRTPSDTSPCGKRPGGVMIDDTERARGCPKTPTGR